MTPDITVRHESGIGMNGYYAVMRDGKKIATIRRSGRSSWAVYTHYWHPLAGFGNVDVAKRAAPNLFYPTKAQVYETICRNLEPKRREEAEDYYHRRFVAIGRALAEGSNSAREELDRLLADIEAFATDRSNPAMPGTEAERFPYRGRNLYPDPPEAT